MSDELQTSLMAREKSADELLASLSVDQIDVLSDVIVSAASNPYLFTTADPLHRAIIMRLAHGQLIREVSRRREALNTVEIP